MYRLCSNIPSFNEKKSRNVFFKFYHVLMLLGVLLILLVLNSSVFSVKKIYVKGEKKLSSSQVVDISEIIMGENILKVNLTKVEKNLKNNPWIKEAEVERKLPSKIMINIVEREPIAFVYFLGSYILIDDEGRVLEVKEEYDFAFPVISGLELKTFKRGEILECQNSSLLERIVEFLVEAEKLDFSKHISQISIDKEHIMLFLTNRIQVKLSKSDKLQQKLAVIHTVFEDIKNKFPTGGLINMTGDNPVLFIKN